jgi:hypothetical protein
MNFGTKWKAIMGEVDKKTVFELLDYYHDQGICREEEEEKRKQRGSKEEEKGKKRRNGRKECGERGRKEDRENTEKSHYKCDFKTMLG